MNVPECRLPQSVWSSRLADPALCQAPQPPLLPQSWPPLFEAVCKQSSAHLAVQQCHFALLVRELVWSSCACRSILRRHCKTVARGRMVDVMCNSTNFAMLCLQVTQEWQVIGAFLDLLTLGPACFIQILWYLGCFATACLTHNDNCCMLLNEV